MVDGIKVISKVYSKDDDVVKYIFETVEGQNEVSLIQKEDKTVLCLPTQTNCKLGCKFCHLTGTSRDTKDLSSSTLVAYVEFFLREYCLNLEEKPLLVSFMGAGEPLHNIGNLVAAMDDLYSKYEVKFGLASTIPSEKRMTEFTENMEDKEYLVKFHLSLHGIDTRSKLMWDKVKARRAIELVEQYKIETVNDVEFHYALVEGLNDTDEEVRELEEALPEGASIKFLVLNPMDDLEPSTHLEEIADYLGDSEKNFVVEVYTPPGRDIGSSCGQFHREIYN
jgi:23S rRNA (adenine2503-C2)-methyltransferase